MRRIEIIMQRSQLEYYGEKDLSHLSKFSLPPSPKGKYLVPRSHSKYDMFST